MPIDQKKLTRTVETLPAFPESAQKIISLTAKVDCSPKQLVKVIEHDPVLTMRVLKLVNSAYFGLSREVTSVNHAVIYVGINTIKNLAISASMTGTLPHRNKAGLDTRNLWHHSLRVGVLARQLAEERGVAASLLVNHFVGGLLHDIGKLLIAHTFPDDYRALLTAMETAQTDPQTLETTMLGITHAEVGARVAEHWKLPLELQHCIRYHHCDEAEVLREHPITLAVSAANRLAHLSEDTRIAIYLPEVVRDWLGTEPEQLLTQLDDPESEFQKAVSFVDVQ